jgi:DNA ligase (NAD+)
LDENPLSYIEGFREKVLKNILLSVGKYKETTLAPFIFALGIKRIGKIAAEDFAQVSLDVDGFLALTEEKLLSISGVGKIVADSFVEF